MNKKNNLGTEVLSSSKKSSLDHLGSIDFIAYLLLVFGVLLIFIPYHSAHAATLNICYKQNTELDLDRSTNVNTRDKLTNPAYFGASGTAAPETFTFSQLASVTSGTLASCDIFFGGGSPQLSATEANDIETWVNAGSRFLIAGCDYSSNQICSTFGRGLTANSNGGVTIDQSLPYNPLACGGALTVGTYGGASTYHGTLPGDVILSTHDGAPTGQTAAVITDGLTSPTFLFTADADMYGSSGRTAIGAGATASTDQALLVVNSFKYAADAIAGRLTNPQCFASYDATADLQLTSSIASSSLAVGGQTTVTFTITNQSGTNSVSGVEAMISLPTGVSYSSQSGSGSYNQSNGIWSVGTLAAGETKTITLTINADSATTDSITAEITNSSLADPDSATNSSFAEDDKGDSFSDDDETSQGITILSYSNGQNCPAGTINLLNNPDFETGNFNGWSQTGTPLVLATYTGAVSGINYTNVAKLDTNTVSGTLRQSVERGLSGGQIFFDFGWNNGNPGTQSIFTFSVGGVDVFQLDTTNTNNNTSPASFSFLNGASGSIGGVAYAANGTGTFPITSYNAWDLLAMSIALPVSVPDGGDLLVSYSLGHDDIAIDNFGLCGLPYDYSDAPTTGTSYGSAYHEVVTGTNLGTGVSNDQTAFDDPNAAADTLDDGITLPQLTSGDTSYSIPIGNISATGSGNLYAWIDFDGDKQFESTEFASTTISAGTATGALNFTGFGSVTASGTTFARFRFTNDTLTNAQFATPGASDGEVEDYELTVYAVNFTTNTTEGNACVAAGGTLQSTNLFTDLDGGSFGTGSGAVDEIPSTDPYGAQITGGTFINTFSGFNHGNYTYISNHQTPRNGSQHGGGIYDPVNGVTGRFFISDPNTSTPTFNSSLTGLTAGQSYEVSFWAADSELNTSNYNRIGILVDSTEVYNTGFIANATSTMEWKKYSFVYQHLGASTTASFDIKSLETGAGGRDFFLDEIKIYECLLPKDYGDAPVTGTSPNTSSTNAYGEASHTIVSGTYLGAGDPDADSANQPSADAGLAGTDGDDGDGTNDEDGISLPSLTQGQTATITATVAGAGGYLQGWIDFDGNGTFDAGEQVVTNLQDGGGLDTDAATGTIAFDVAVPAGATTNQTFARFRWSTTQNLDSTTAANDGEVEDYALDIGIDPSSFACSSKVDVWYANDESGSVSPTEFTQARDFIYQVTDGFYHSFASGAQGGIVGWAYGAQPVNVVIPITETFYDPDDTGLATTGTTVDGDGLGVRENYTVKVDTTGGTQLANATNGVANLINAGNGRRTGVPQVAVILTDAPSSQINNVSGNGGGSAWEAAAANLRAAGPDGTRIALILIAEAAEAYTPGSPGYSAASKATIDAVVGANGIVITTDTYAAAADPANTYINDAITSICSVATFAPEDDYSDAPTTGTSPNGSSTNAYGEATHAVTTGIQLGANIDSDSASIADPNAAGDGADDDGLATLPALTESAAYTLQVTTVGTGTLTGWIDYNGNGTFDTDESITGNFGISSTGGVVDVPIHIPAGSQGTTFMRLRYSTDTAARNPDGAASDGEVEDYQITIGAKIANPTDPATVITEGSVCTAYNATGADQTVTAPVGAKGLSIKLWGAGGGHEIVGIGYSGAGGYTEAQFDNNVVTPGTQYTLVVGNGGNTSGRPDEFTPASIYGFGSVSGHDQGGGLTGLFTGIDPVLETDQARALAVAGGGAGYENSGSGTGTNGGNGNSPTSGGQPSMRGSTDVSPYYNGLTSTAHRGGGGGGYFGGGRLPALNPYSNVFDGYQFETAAAAGGAGYVATSAVAGRLLFSADGTITPPNTGDADYVAGIGTGSTSSTSTAGGNGLAVLCWEVDDHGDAPVSYGDALHSLTSDVYLGSTIDGELTAINGPAATGDDLDGSSDEDGLATPLAALHTHDRNYSVSVNVNNTSTNAATLMGWIDVDGNGTFDADEVALRTIPAGTANTTVDLQWSVLPIDITAGNTFIRLRLTTDSIAPTEPAGAKNDGEVEDYLIPITVEGYSVSGRVYQDANVDGVNDTSETGVTDLPVVLMGTITSTGAAVCISTRTDGDGNYQFNNVLAGNYQVYEASRENVPTPASCDTANAKDPAGYVSTTDNVSAAVAVVAADVTGIDFGDVKSPSFSPDHTGTILPGNVTFYAHQFLPQSTGSVVFATANNTPATAGWSSVVYQDSNCNGQLDSAEITAPVSSVNTTANTKVCLINKVSAPSNVNDGESYSNVITANFTYGTPANAIAGTTTLTVTDLTKAAANDPQGGSSRLELKKTVQVYRGSPLSAVSAETETQNAARPGDVLKYRIYYSNTGSATLSDLVINDVVPEFTTINGVPVCESPLPASLTSCTPSVSGDTIEWLFPATDTLQAGGAGVVSYEVLID